MRYRTCAATRGEARSTPVLPTVLGITGAGAGAGGAVPIAWVCSRERGSVQGYWYGMHCFPVVAKMADFAMAMTWQTQEMGPGFCGSHARL